MTSRKAIILCAGYGTRLGRLTQCIPKPMLTLSDKPMLEYAILHLASQGFKDIGINMHYKYEQISSYFGDGSAFGVRIHYEYEPSLLGTAGALWNFHKWLNADDNFLVMYGDIITNQRIAPLWTKQIDTNSMATLLVHRRPGSNSQITVDDTGRIVEFIERPSHQQIEDNTLSWVNSAVHVLNRRVFDFISKGEVVDLPRDIFAPLVRRERMHVVPLSGYRCAIDSENKYRRAQKDVENGVMEFAVNHRHEAI